MLDINLLRSEKGFHPEAIAGESQRRRRTSVQVVDEAVNLDKESRQRELELDALRRNANRLAKEVRNLKTAGKDAKEVTSSIAAQEWEVQAAKPTLDSELETLSNLIHDSVPVCNDENDERSKQYVHMPISTLTATERTICCILENYQTEDGVISFMGGKEILPFKPEPEAKSRKSKAKETAEPRAGR